MPAKLTEELRKELRGTPELEELQEEHRHSDPSPKPDSSECYDLYNQMRAEFERFHTRIRDERESRYLQQPLPNKLEEQFQYGSRVHTRLMHNEIMRVVAMLTRNRPKIRIPPKGTSEKARKRASTQQRWCQELLGYLERHSRKPLWRTVADHQVGDGLGAWYIYLTEAYDAIEKDLERKEVYDEDLDMHVMESTRDYNKRVDELLQECGLPFGIRYLDPMCLYYKEDEEGPYVAVVAERKERRAVYRSIKERNGADAEDYGLPPVGGHGSPLYTHKSEYQNPELDYAECVEYWDRDWYAYFVDGHCVTEPKRHHLPGVPIIPVEGMTTGSPNIAERLQSVVWGLDSTQHALDSLLSLEMDTALTYGRPKPVIHTPPDGNILRDAQNRPEVLDLSKPGAHQLMPGQQITDALKDFRPKDTDHIQQMLLSFWQRSGLNPIAQGESPGADPAGYTVNSLQGAAQSNYEVFLDNMARSWGLVCDYIRLLIRDTINEKVWLSAPMNEAGSHGETQWLSLGPDDIDQTPAVVFIDPLSDANRMNKVQMMAQMNKEGFVPRRLVQEALPEGEDPEAWDNELVLDSAEQQLNALAMDEAMRRIRMKQQEEEPSPGGPGGAPGGPPGQQMPGAPPGPPGAPTVGADQAAASQGPGEGRPGPPMMNSARMQAGTSNGYTPPPGQMTETEGGGQ